VFQLDLGLEDVDFAPKPRRYLGSQHLFPRHSRSFSQRMFTRRTSYQGWKILPDNFSTALRRERAIQPRPWPVSVTDTLGDRVAW